VYFLPATELFLDERVVLGVAERTAVGLEAHGARPR
jgi:hypothetical protein